MKRIFLVLLTFLVFACAKEETASIKGTALDLPDGTTLYLQELGENNKKTSIDTAQVAEGKFVFTSPISEGPGILVISSKEKPQDQLLLVKDQELLTVTLYADSLSASIVRGSIRNELFNQYRNTARQHQVKRQLLTIKMQQAQRETDGVAVTMAKEQLTEMDKNFILDKKAIVEAHPNKMVSIVALSDLINAKVLKIEESEAYYEGLSENIKNTSIGGSIKKYIAQLKSQRILEGLATVGNKAPSFTAKTPEGTDLSLEETLGKYTIIDFWASWCRPCRMENPNVVSVYNQYHDKGLNIISVSLDRQGQEERWKKAIKDDKMDWYHVSNLKFWQDPIPRSYGVRSIPSTFLLDDKGIIIAKNLRGAALGAKIKELLGDS